MQNSRSSQRRNLNLFNLNNIFAQRNWIRSNLFKEKKKRNKIKILDQIITLHTFSRKRIIQLHEIHDDTLIIPVIGWKKTERRRRK